MKLLLLLALIQTLIKSSVIEELLGRDL